MIIAKQSTARTVTVGPVLDADGVAVTDAVVGDFKISKNGGAPAALNASATLTHRNTGHYSLALTASDLDTVGQAEIVIDDTTNACPMKEITVIEEAIYDALFAGSANAFSGSAGSTTLTALATGSITAAVIATGAIDADAIADNAIDAGAIATGAITSAKFAAGAIDAAAIANGAIDAATFAADVDAEILSYLVDDATRIDASALNTASGAIGSNGSGLTEAGGTGDHLTAVPWNASWDAEVQSEVQDAIEANHLDHLLAATYDPASKPGVADALLNELVENDGGVARYTANALEQAPTGGSAPTVEEIRAEIDSNSTQLAAIVAKIGTPSDFGSGTSTIAANLQDLADNGTATYDRSTDSLQAIRDRGDAAWTTATGFSTLDAAEVRTAVGLASANLDTQLSTIDGNVDSILEDTGADGVALASSTCNKIADHVRRRTQANVEASSDGDSLSLHSQYGAIQQIQESAVSGGTLTVYRTDGSTSLGTRTVASSSGAEPITGVS